MAVSEQEDGHIRALVVLETLAGLEQPASLPTIAGEAQLTKTKAYRILRGLQDHGFVDHVGRGGYRIGSRAVALASLIGPRPALLRLARPVLAKLAAEASETVTLHLRSGAHRVLVQPAVSGDRSPIVGSLRSGLPAGSAPRTTAPHSAPSPSPASSSACRSRRCCSWSRRCTPPAPCSRRGWLPSSARTPRSGWSLSTTPSSTSSITTSSQPAISNAPSRSTTRG